MEIKAGATWPFTKEIPELRAAMVYEHFLQMLHLLAFNSFRCFPKHKFFV